MKQSEHVFLDFNLPQGLAEIDPQCYSWGLVQEINRFNMLNNLYAISGFVLMIASTSWSTSNRSDQIGDLEMAADACSNVLFNFLCVQDFAVRVEKSLSTSHDKKEQAFLSGLLHDLQPLKHDASRKTTFVFELGLQWAMSMGAAIITGRWLHGKGVHIGKAALGGYLAAWVYNQLYGLLSWYSPVPAPIPQQRTMGDFRERIKQFRQNG